MVHRWNAQRQKLEQDSQRTWIPTRKGIYDFSLQKPHVGHSDKIKIKM